MTLRSNTKLGQPNKIHQHKDIAMHVTRSYALLGPDSEQN